MTTVALATGLAVLIALVGLRSVNAVPATVEELDTFLSDSDGNQLTDTDLTNELTIRAAQESELSDPVRDKRSCCRRCCTTSCLGCSSGPVFVRSVLSERSSCCTQSCIMCCDPGCNSGGGGLTWV